MARYGLLGEKLGHSYSPAIHQMFGRYPYGLFECPRSRLGAFLESGTFDGVNVNAPFKKMALPYCDELSPDARQSGIVNTIVRRPDGTLYGDNTDVFGFTFMVRRSGIDPKGKKILILGSGAASATARDVLSVLGAREIVVVSRTGENNYWTLTRHADAQIIVNATPVGSFPYTGVLPVDLLGFPCLEGVLDMVYNPARTALVMEAQRLGIPCLGGTLMLVAQAKKSCELFTGAPVDDSEIDRVDRGFTRTLQNIVLIGMPGCGKSTVARELGKQLDRPVLHVDTLVEAISGMTIPEIFARYGEEAFRQWETDAITQFGKRSGVVISTGGGCVTRPNNYPLLHQNGTIFYLERDLDKLPTEGRPISQSRDLRELYDERRPLYRYFADYEVDNNGAVEDTARQIIQALA